jgi:hypothetical protein
MPRYDITVPMRLHLTVDTDRVDAEAAPEEARADGLEEAQRLADVAVDELFAVLDQVSWLENLTDDDAPRIADWYVETDDDDQDIRLAAEETTS